MLVQRWRRAFKLFNFVRRKLNIAVIQNTFCTDTKMSTFHHTFTNRIGSVAPGAFKVDPTALLDAAVLAGLVSENEKHRIDPTMINPIDVQVALLARATKLQTEIESIVASECVTCKGLFENITKPFGHNHDEL